MSRHSSGRSGGSRADGPSASLLPLLCLGLWACGARPQERPALLAPARSAVVVLVDTLRADHLGCYGYERDTSPRIDRFADEAIRFERCVAQSTWTKPATVSLLTGLYPEQHGMFAPDRVQPEELVSIAGRLQEAGLRTGAFVTSHWISSKVHGLRAGFDEFPLLTDHPEGDPYTRADVVVDTALAWIESQGEERFFCYLHTLDPHAPYGAPEPYGELFVTPGASDVKGDHALHGAHMRDLPDADVQRLIDLYDGEIAYTDAQFGRLLDGLERLGRSEDTIVVLTADHGEALGEHGKWAHGPFMYREVIHVPLIVRLPPASGLSGLVRSDVCGQIDVLPTLLHGLGLPPDLELPGRSLLEWVEPGEGQPRFSEIHGGTTRKAMVTHGYKYVRQWSPDSRELLFDLAQDPSESTNVVGEDPRELAHLRSAMDTFVASTGRGFSLLVQNGLRRVRIVEVELTSNAPFLAGSMFYAEDRERHGDRRDGPVELSDTEEGGRMTARFHLEPRAGDGLLFETGPEATSVAVRILVDGEPAAPEHVRIGSAAVPPGALPFCFDPGDAESLLAPPRPARQNLDGAPYRISLRCNRAAASRSAELGADERDALRALGYLGGDG